MLNIFPTENEIHVDVDFTDVLIMIHHLGYFSVKCEKGTQLFERLVKRTAKQIFLHSAQLFGFIL